MALHMAVAKSYILKLALLVIKCYGKIVVALYASKK